MFALLYIWPTLNKLNKNNSDKICAECGITYDTPRDKELKKSEEYQWIGCYGDKFHFWGHAKCLSVTVENVKNGFLFQNTKIEIY